MAHQELYKRIKIVYDRATGRTGAPRVVQGLERQGVACSENCAARLMRLRGPRACLKEDPQDCDYRKMMKDRGRQVAMNGFGTWYDIALMASFLGTLKSDVDGWSAGRGQRA